jgi:isocitrate lyase
MGYKFQFVTLAGFHSLNLSMIELARGYRERGMAAYAELQQAEFAAEAAGYTRDASLARSGCRVVRCNGDCRFGWTIACH